MSVSPGPMRRARSITTCSVAAPAGTITHATRGALSFATKSSSVTVPTAPSPATSWTVFALLAYATTSWPPRMSRRAMLPPIRPRPTIPICMLAVLPSGPWISLLRRRLDDRVLERHEPALHVLAEVDPQRAAPTLDEHLEIALRLGRLHHTERVPLARHRHVRRVVAGELEEHAGVRPALVGLARRVQKARAEADARRHAEPVADRAPDRPELGLVRTVHLDVGEQRDVVAGRDLAEVVSQHRGQVRVARPHRRRVREPARLLPLLGQPVRGQLARLDVGLIEGIDPEDRARHRRRELPAEELGAEVVGVLHVDLDDRVARRLEGGDGRVLRRFRC